MIHRRAGPLQPRRPHALVGHAAVLGDGGAHLLEDVLRRPPVEPLRAHRLGDGCDDLPVDAGLPRRLHGLPDTLHPPLGGGEGPLLLGVAGRGEDHVGELRRLGHEDLLHRDELHGLEPLFDVVGVGVGHDGVLAHDEHRLEGPLMGGVEHLGDLVARLAGELPPPELLEEGQLLRVRHLLVAREVRGQRGHVAGALDVVLPAQGVDPRVRKTNMPRQEPQVGEVLDVVRPADVLRDPERVEDARLPGRGVEARGLVQLLARNARDGLDPLGSVGLDALQQGLVPLAALFDVGLVLPALLDDDAHHPVDQGDVGARAQGQPQVRHPRELRAARVHDDQLRAPAHGLFHLDADDGMRLGGVGPDDEEQVLVQDFVHRVRHGAASQ